MPDAHPGDVLLQHPTVLEVALAIVDADHRDRYGPENAVQPWYMAPCGPTDHIYPTCPGLRRSLRPGEEPNECDSALYPEAGDVCGWCVRVWRAQRGKTPDDADQKTCGPEGFGTSRARIHSSSPRRHTTRSRTG